MSFCHCPFGYHTIDKTAFLIDCVTRGTTTKLAADQRFPLTWSPLACRRQSVCSGAIIINFWQHSPVTFTAWRWRLPGGRASTEQKRFVGTNALCHPVLTTDTKRKGVERNTTQQVVIIARNLCCMRNLYLSICDELFSTGSLQSGNPCFGTARRTRRSQQLQQQRGKKVGGKLYKCFRFDFLPLRSFSDGFLVWTNFPHSS